MWCHEREDNINKMLSSLPEETEVIWDIKNNACDTLCRTVNSNESILVMEDDIELCKDFYSKALNEISKRPDEFIMFYSFGLMEQKKLYFISFVYTQAYYIPSGLGIEMAEFLKDNKDANNFRYSKWIAQYLNKKRIRRYTVRPSLVQHIWKESLLEPWVRPLHKSQTYKYE